MDVRELLVDGVDQLYDWMNDAVAPLNRDQVNFLPEGSCVSIGFNYWHVVRTHDNITNFVFQRKQPIWVAEGYFEKMGLPKVDQGTGMGIEDARRVVIEDPNVLVEYGQAVGRDTIAFIKTVDPAILEEMQMIKPLGEMPKWKVLRQVIMTHGFMHLGEINAMRGSLGLSFSI